jgi:hypothetical protein
MTFLQASQFEILVYQAVTEEVFHQMEVRDENLAVRIANAVARAFNGS